MASAKIIYFIALAVDLLIFIAPLSCLAQTSHLNPLSSKLKYSSAPFSPQDVHLFIIAEENRRELEIIAKLYLNDKLDKEYKIEDLF